MNFDVLRAIARRELGTSRPLFLTISGAHLYGFPSPDSDFDVRGCHLLPLPEVLSLKAPRETRQYTGIEDGREIDFVSHDAGKFFRLMLRKNGYVMEQIFSPLVVEAHACFEELRDIARGCVTRHIVHHYRGFAESELLSLDDQAEKRVKTTLYAYRVLLTGIHVLRSGAIEADLRKLLELRPLERVGELIERKTTGAEKGTLPPDDAAWHREALTRLRAELETAAAESTLPEAPAKADALDDLLIRLRLNLESGISNQGALMPPSPPTG
ncbi:MAG TPA: nucleotidyltransferase domain-containing protein [Planctomycetota bacterium]